MSAGYNAAPGSGAVPPGHWPPPAVAAAAQQHQLGAHLSTHRPPVPSSGALIGVLIGVGMVVLGCVLLGLAREADPYSDPSFYTDPDSSGGSGLFWLLRIAAGASCIGGVALLAKGIRSAASRPQPESYYLYEGGIIHFTRGFAQVLTWPEIREARPLAAPDGAGAVRVTHYSLVRHQGMPFPVPVNLQHGPDPFLEQLLAILRSRDVTVHAAGSP